MPRELGDHQEANAAWCAARCGARNDSGFSGIELQPPGACVSNCDRSLLAIPFQGAMLPGCFLGHCPSTSSQLILYVGCATARMLCGPMYVKVTRQMNLRWGQEINHLPDVQVIRWDSHISKGLKNIQASF